MVAQKWEFSAKIYVYRREKSIEIYKGAMMVEPGVIWAKYSERGGSNMSKDAGNWKESGICQD